MIYRLLDSTYGSIVIALFFCFLWGAFIFVVLYPPLALITTLRAYTSPAWIASTSCSGDGTCHVPVDSPPR